GAGKLVLKSTTPLTVLGPEGGLISGTPPATSWTVVTDGPGLALVAPDGWRSARQSSVTFAATSPASSISLGERNYRGRLELTRDDRGITAVNRLGVESYLAGVLSAEMGRRDSTDTEALEAQAVVSRTFAIRNLGKRRSEGFDLYASVADQVYGGIGSETPMAWDAVRQTTGQVITWQGALIDAFFHSTCGGRTADGTEVYAGANRPYLRSVPDVDENGQAYCRISPRFQWRQEWTRATLLATLQKTLPDEGLASPGAVTDVRAVRVISRTASDRADKVEIDLGTRVVTVSGPDIRLVLRMSGDALLRSNRFSLTEQYEGSRFVGLVADGGGAGHGVGFCQWGAVGRARAGQHYPQILLAYFPGTELERLY
ncbi:MAG TPA: SpoIID/LytB domain-containing protein, partial [Gemmatimonadales bacterium]|nr:SpoIID/LytB domain-containing protein [Gemmatimonadales bacterium]